MSKQFREQIRVDMLTSQLMFELINKMSTNQKKMTKSELFRTAVYRMAKEELSPDEFTQAVNAALDLENI
jgi:hypothetical protein